MLCPRCQVPVKEGQCPSCGIVWDSEYGSETPTVVESSVGGPITFEVLDPKPRPTASTATADWRKELRRRLDQRSGKGGESPDEEQEAVTTDSSETAASGASVEEESPRQGDAASKLFDYQLKRPAKARPLVNPVRPKEETTRRQKKPALREHSLSGEGSADKDRSSSLPSDSVSGPLQRKLKLEVGGSFQGTEEASKRAPEVSRDSGPVPADRPAPSREILLSRFLAGIIDVTVPLALGMSFALVAAWRIDFDFFAYSSLRMALLFSLGFYFFNSIFFLLLSGQTPGMYAAQLSLADPEGRDDVLVSSILLRVVLFLPSCLSIVGLVWSIFDPERRCLHDILSGSVVISSGATEVARNAVRRL